MKKRIFILTLILSLVCWLPAGAYWAENESDPSNAVGETALGLLTADALRLTTGSDVAIVVPAELGAALDTAAITQEALAQSYPQDLAVMQTDIPVRSLWQLLEQMLSCLTLTDTGLVNNRRSDITRFPQVSGLRFVYDPAQKAGSRLLSLATEDGTVLDAEDEETTLTLCGSLTLLSGGYGGPAAESVRPAGTQRELMMEFFSAATVDEAPQDGRAILMTDRSHSGLVLAGRIARWTIAAGLLSAGILFLGSDRKRRQFP